MNPTSLPGLSLAVTNGLQLSRQMARAIGFIQAYRQTSKKEPAAAAQLVAWIDAAKAYINAGVISEEPEEGETASFTSGFFTVPASSPAQHIAGYLPAALSPTGSDLGTVVSGDEAIFTLASFGYNGPVGEPLDGNRSVAIAITKAQLDGPTAVRIDWGASSTMTLPLTWDSGQSLFTAQSSGGNESPILADTDPFTLTLLY